MKTLVIFLAALLVQLSTISVASAKEDFFWNGKTYGRGVGTIPDRNCASTKVKDAGLCYDSCRPDYKLVAGVCWFTGDSSYGRGAGTTQYSKYDAGKAKTTYYCHDGKQLQNALCYTPCRSGYSGNGPVCYNNNTSSYTVGAGTAPPESCAAGNDLDTSLCYASCRAGFKGAGPVCWSTPPTGYVSCGMGFATSDLNCGIVTATQAASVGFFLAANSPAAAAAWTAKMAKLAKMSAVEVKAGKEFMTELYPMMKNMQKIMEPAIKELGKGANIAADMAKLFDDFLKVGNRPAMLKELMLLKAGSETAYSMMYKDQYAPIDIVRDVLGIVSVFDDTWTLDVIASFMYPTYNGL